MRLILGERPGVMIAYLPLQNGETLVMHRARRATILIRRDSAGNPISARKVANNEEKA